MALNPATTGLRSLCIQYGPLQRSALQVDEFCVLSVHALTQANANDFA